MSDRCDIRIDLSESNLVIDAQLAEGEPLRLERGRSAAERLLVISSAYRSLVALRSFAEENDEAVLSYARSLGRELYALVFAGLDHLLENADSLLVEHVAILVPIELACSGEQFLGLRLPIGNVFRSTHRDRPFRRPATGRGVDARILLLGDDEGVWRRFERNNLCHLERAPLERDLLYRALRSDEWNVLHVSGHGSYDQAESRGGRLVLTGSHHGRREEAVLDWNHLGLSGARNRLVFLNTCHSGRIGEQHMGLTGLADVLLRSGAANCVATLWSIDDAGAQRFAAQFYSALLGGTSVGESLRRARASCWLERRDILTGMSYILFGDPNEVVPDMPHIEESDVEDLQERQRSVIGAGTFGQISPLLESCLDAVDSTLRNAVAVAIAEQLERRTPAAEGDPLRRIDKSLNERDTYYVVHDDDLRLLKEVGGVAAALYPLLKNPVATVGALFALLFRYRRKRAKIGGQEAAVLLALRTAPVGGWTLEEVAGNLPVDMEVGTIGDILKRCRDVRLDDGTRTSLVAERDGKWWTVDI